MGEPCLTQNDADAAVVHLGISSYLALLESLPQILYEKDLRERQELQVVIAVCVGNREACCA